MALSNMWKIVIGIILIAVLAAVITVAVSFTKKPEVAEEEEEEEYEEEPGTSISTSASSTGGGGVDFGGEEEDDVGEGDTSALDGLAPAPVPAPAPIVGSAEPVPAPTEPAPAISSVADTAAVVATFGDANISLNGTTYQLQPSSNTIAYADGKVTLSQSAYLSLTRDNAPELDQLAQAFNKAYTVNIWMRSSSASYANSDWIQVFGFGTSANYRALGLSGWINPANGKWHLHNMWFNQDLSVDTAITREQMQQEEGQFHMYTVSWSQGTLQNPQPVRKIYMDGVLVKDANGVEVGKQEAFDEIPNFSSDVLYIGRYVNNISLPYITSTFADFRAWTTQLSDDAVHNLYLEGVL